MMLSTMSSFLGGMLRSKLFLWAASNTRSHWGEQLGLKGFKWILEAPSPSPPKKEGAHHYYFSPMFPTLYFFQSCVHCNIVSDKQAPIEGSRKVAMLRHHNWSTNNVRPDNDAQVLLNRNMKVAVTNTRNLTPAFLNRNRSLAKRLKLTSFGSACQLSAAGSEDNIT